MAAASYTTDLATHDDCTTITNFSEPTGMQDLNGAGEVDGDLAIYGSVCVSEAMRKTGLGALMTDPAARTLPTNGAFFLWFKWFAPNSLDTKVGGGIRVLIGNTTANYYGWYVDGADTYPYGGWVNYAVDPTKNALAVQQQGTPNTTYQAVGMGVDCPISTPQKGNSFTMDIIRYGRGQLLITGGTTPDPAATFEGASIVNDNETTGRWGLFQDQGGSYLWKGLLQLGDAGTVVNFEDANRVINVEDTEFCDSDFNRIEIRNASSTVDWTGISISALGTVGRGNLQVVDNATVAMTNCTFTDMGFFQFNGGANPNTLVGNTFRRCFAVTQGGASITGGLFEDANDSAAILITDTAGAGLANVSTTFNRTNTTTHAIKVTDTITTDVTRTWDNILEGYPAGTTGPVAGPSGVDSAALEVNVSTGNTLTLNVAAGSTVPSVQNLGLGTVDVVAAVTVRITGLEDSSEIRIFEAGTTTPVAGAESVVGGVGTGVTNGTVGTLSGKNTFSFTTSSGASLDVIPFNINLNSIPNYGYTVPANGGDLPVVQTGDAVYEDPA